DVIAHNQLLDFRSKRISMPWSQGVFRLIFPEQRSCEPLLPLPSPPPGLFSGGGASVQQTPSEALPTATHAFARQRARLAALAQSEDSVRFEALRKIKTLTLLDPPSSELGRHIIAEAAILSDPGRLQKSFNDTFAMKSTATLAKQSASFWRFAEFCLASGFGSPFRAGESILYAYVQDLQAHGAATSANAFLESWNFFASLLGFANQSGQSPISGRVRGAASSLAATKKRLVQATPLSVAMLRALERIVVKPPYPHWQVIAGHILFCVGSCARFSDTMHLQSLDLSSADGMHLLEAASASYKTAQGERKTMLMPLLSLGSFVYPTVWAPLWMQARRDQGLTLSPSLPAFSEAAQVWLPRRMSTGELTLYLKEFLVASHIELPAEARISSHSMKATFLSWLAKFGGVSLEDRRIAGHHLDAGARSPLTYSRDELCRLMKIFEDVLKAIRAGTFKPDDSRVMRLAVMCGSVLQEKVLEKDPCITESEAGESDVDLPALEARTGGIPLEDALTAEAVSSVCSKMHIFSRTVHIQAAEGARFLCGRPITRNFDELDKAVPASDLLVCHNQCDALSASEAAFKARALELNLPEDLITKLAAINVDTFGALAFIGPLQAGTTDEGPLISMLKRALGSAPDDGVLSIARRLWFESTTQALAEMRGKVERTDASEPQRMPLAERTQRIAALQKRLVGIHWTVDIEPSHKLQDSVAQMVTDQSLVWIPWDRLTSRSLEITAEKLDPSVSFDSSGNLKLIKRSADPSCNTTGEYAVKLALQRRSLAFELGRICRYEYLEAWHDQLLQIHMRQQLAGHQRVSLNQLREADKMLWTRIAEDTRGALSIRPDGTYPFEASLAKWKDHTQVQCYLMPLLRSAPAPTLVPQPPADKGNGKGRHQKQTGKDIKKDNPNAEKPSSADGDKKKTWTVPAGCHSRDNDGKPLCFSFNLKGCNFCKPGKRCRRGRHLCWNVVTPFFKDDETGGERLAAEELARELLQGETISSGDLVRLSMALPSEVPSRGRNSGGRSVSLGAFAFSGSQRLLVRDASRQYPLSTRVFARFLRQLSKDFTCTTIAVFTNLRTALHQDTANDPNSRNLLYPLTAFSGGGVWVESPDGVTTYMHDGKARTGHVLPVSEGLCFLDAPNPQHVTLEWQGERSLLVGYSATGAADMPAEVNGGSAQLKKPSTQLSFVR
ncbi:unnamed protein product, partial [Symbiodinium microadriaticum]